MKKIVIFGGGSGLSQMLKGLKLFPIDITAVVSVFANGGSTLRLRKDFNIPAVGDISKVMLAMSNTDTDIVNLMNYRFKQSKSLGNHSVKNLLLTALLEQKGDFASAIPVLSKLLDIEGKILPITEDNAELVAISEDGKKIIGETNITKTKKKIKNSKEDYEYIENHHKPIIDMETWDTVQKILKGKGRQKINSSDELLKPLLYCSHCHNHFNIT